MMGRILFTTGTDTGIGKTMVSRALKHGFSALGFTAQAYKPIESGCPIVNGQAFGDDALALAGSDSALLEGIRLKAPLAPSVAARLEGHPPININERADTIRRLASRSDVLIVEGVGGLMVPINDKEFVIDLIRAIAPDAVILVAGNRLGVLNHTISAAFLLDCVGHQAHGIVLNQLTATPEGPAESTNLSELQHWLDRVVAFPFISDDSEDQLTEVGKALVRALAFPFVDPPPAKTPINDWRP